MLTGAHMDAFLERNRPRLSSGAAQALGANPGQAPRARGNVLTGRGYSHNWQKLYDLLWATPEARLASDGRGRTILGKFSDGEPFAEGRVLEVGVGQGRFLRLLIRENPDGTFVGLDLSDGVDFARRVIDDDRVLLIQADILQPPIRENSFDLCLSYGVLHHTPDPQNAFAHCWQFLAQRGRLLVWLYGDRLRQRSRRLYRWSCRFRSMHSRLPPNVLWRICWWYGLISWVVGPLVRRWFPYRTRFRDTQRFWMDNLVNPYNFVFNREELLPWRPENAQAFDVRPLFGGWRVRAERSDGTRATAGGSEVDRVPSQVQS